MTSAIKIWYWLKKNVKIIFAVLVGIILLLVFAGRRNDIAFSMIERFREDHRKELDAINRSNQQEQEDIESANQRHGDRLELIAAEYADKIKDLEIEKQAAVLQLIENNKDNPDEVARRLAEITGFKLQ